MKTSGLGQFKLGQPLPSGTHAVCVSLPKFADVIGYEEKDPATLSSMPSGYPRFVRHQLIQRMINHLCVDSVEKTSGYLFAREQDCEQAIKRYQIQDCKITHNQDWTLLELPADSEKNSLISAYFQHTGCGISSRLAEDFLWDRGLVEQREVLSETPEAESVIKQRISQAHGPQVSADDLLLASSGANAFHALFKAATEQAISKNKSIWIRWGWLYLDTIEVMDLYGKESGKVLEVNAVGNTDELISLFDKYGNEIAGVVTEFPTNPLLQAGDLELVRKLCDQSGALLIIDPTMVSPKNAKITSTADVVVNSLTKYAGWEGDVMMGSLAFPQCSKLGKELFLRTEELICPPYHRDILRMAEQIPFYDHFIESANKNALQVAEFLENHPGVKKVHWAYQHSFRSNYEKFAGENNPGCNLSFEINGDFKKFYDHLEMLKSPSFGTEFSNCCPYVYLAHYSLIQTEKGRQKLQDAGIHPELLRLSVGMEGAEKITATLDLALQYSQT